MPYAVDVARIRTVNGEMEGRVLELSDLLPPDAAEELLEAYTLFSLRLAKAIELGAKEESLE